MRKIIVITLLAACCTTSCASFNNWLFKASDYRMIEPKDKTNEEEDEENWNDIFGDDIDYDIWLEEAEYD